VLVHHTRLYDDLCLLFTTLACIDRLFYYSTFSKLKLKKMGGMLWLINVNTRYLLNITVVTVICLFVSIEV